MTPRLAKGNLFFALPAKRLAKLLGDKLQDTPQRVALCRWV